MFLKNDIAFDNRRQKQVRIWPDNYTVLLQYFICSLNQQFHYLRMSDTLEAYDLYINLFYNKKKNYFYD